MSIPAIAAVAFEPKSRFSIEDVMLDPPGEGEVLVELKAAGLCHTDFGVLQGKSPIPAQFPIVLGHEGAGVVLEVGPGVKHLQPGDHVLSFGAECRQCASCQSGKGNFCERSIVPPRETIGIGDRRATAAFGMGTFASHAVMREIALPKVRKDAPFDQICYLSCGAATGLGAALYTAKVEPGSSVIVFGLGGIGLNVIQGARIAGASTIIGVDISDAKGAAASRLGATHFVNSSKVEGDLVGHLNELTQGGADFTFEAVGNIGLMQQAFAAARIGYGVCTVIGLPDAGQTIPVAPFDLILGRRLLGTALGGIRGRSDIPGIVDMLMEGQFDLASLVTDRLPLTQINEGYEKLHRGESLRSVVIFD